MNAPGRSARLVGRARECAAFEARLDDALRKDGSLTVLHGDAGVGKSRLIRRWSEMAHARGFRVVAVANFPFAGEPYGPLAEACRSLARSEPRGQPRPGEERALFARFLDFGGSAQDVEPAWHKRRIFVIVHDFLERSAAFAPLMLVVDDVQWSDPDSLEMLEYLASRLEGLRLVIVLAHRTESEADAGPVPAALASVERLPASHRIDVRPLSPGEIRELILDLWPAHRDIEQRIVDAICARSEGTPLFAEDLVNDVLSGGSAARLPPSVERSVHERLQRLDSAAVALLEAAAAIGPVVDLALLEALVSADPGAQSAALRRARDLGLIEETLLGEPPRFRHDLVREAIYRRLGAGERRRLHERIAQLLEARPGIGPQPLAGHWKSAGDPERTARYAESAGDAALAHFAPATARDHYAAALATGVLPESAAARVSEKLGGCHEQLANAAASYAAFAAAADYHRRHGEQADRARLSLRLARSAFRVADEEAALEHCADALALTGEQDAERFAALVWLATCHASAGRAVEAESHLRACDAFAGPRDGEYEIRFHVARSTVAHLRGDAQVARDAAAHAVRIAEVHRDPVLLALSWQNVADIARWRAEFALADSALTRALTIADENAATYTSVTARLIAADMAFLRGEATRAHALLRSACALAAEGARIRYYAAAVGIPIALAVGDEALLERLADRSLLTGVLDSATPEIAAVLAAAHAERLAYDGERAAAQELIARALARLTGATYVEDALFKFARFGTERQANEAHRLLHVAAADRDVLHDIYALLVEAIVHRFAADGAAVRTCAEEARSRARTFGLRLLEAFASELLDEGAAAGEIYAAMGAPRLAHATSGTAERTPRVVVQLTAREREVATLVARGLSNRAIGERLGRSDRTVEHHIGSIFSKLDIRTRAELAVLMSASAGG